MAEVLPQLFMRKPDMTSLPYLCLPEKFALHNHTEGTERVWEHLIEEAFGNHYSFDGFIRNGGGYRPEYVLYISKGGVDIATCTAVEKDMFPGEGWIRMLGTHPSARGESAGRLVLTAALHSLAARGYHSVVLSTDDYRIPAISLYLSLGFRPLLNHASHEARWLAIIEKLQNSGKLKIDFANLLK